MAVKILNGIDVSGSLNLAASDIPSLDASKIGSGTINSSRMPNIDASKITSGTFAAARIPNIDASKITAGTFHSNRMPDLSGTYALAAHNHDDVYYTESEVDAITHQWEWRWIRWQSYVSQSTATEEAWTTYYKNFFTERTAATDATYPEQDNGYVNTLTNVASNGGFGGSAYGNMFGNLSSYHALIYTNIYVEKEFTVNITDFNGDDPHAIFIDGVYVLGDIQCCRNMAYDYTFTPGWHRIDLIYAEGGGGDYIVMGWNPKDYTAYISDMTPHRAGENPRNVLNKLNALGTLATESYVTSQGYITGVAWNDVTGKPTLDNYGSWNLKTGGVQRTTVQSGGTLDIVGGTNVSVSYGAGGVVTISSTDNNTWRPLGTSATDAAAGNHTHSEYLTSVPAEYLTQTEGDARYLQTLPSHSHDDRYLVKGGSWNGVNMPGSRWGGFSVNGGEVVFQRDNPNNGQMSVMVDGNFYAGERNGFWSLYSNSPHNDYNAKVGFYSNTSGHFLISTSAVYAGGNQVWHAGNLTNNSSNWNTAYGWGNHASAGYLTSYTETSTLDNVIARNNSTWRTPHFGEIHARSFVTHDLPIISRNYGNEMIMADVFGTTSFSSNVTNGNNVFRIGDNYAYFSDGADAVFEVLTSISSTTNVYARDLVLFMHGGYTGSLRIEVKRADGSWATAIDETGTWYGSNWYRFRPDWQTCAVYPQDWSLKGLRFTFYDYTGGNNTYVGQVGITNVKHHKVFPYLSIQGGDVYGTVDFHGSTSVGGSAIATQSWVNSQNFQASGNYFTDGDTVLNMANNDGLEYNDTNNLMYVKADGTNYAIIDSRGGTVNGNLAFSSGANINMSNGNITGVNQIEINDPGEGIIWTSGASGSITLAVKDDASDNILNLSGTGATLTVNDARVATESWVGTQGYATQSYVNTAVSNLVDSAPGTLNTLNELAAALGDDPNFASTITTSLGTKVSWEYNAGDVDPNDVNRNRGVFSINGTTASTPNRPQNYNTIYTFGGGSNNTLQIGTGSDYNDAGLWVRQYNHNASSPQGVGWQNWATVWTSNDFANNSANWNVAYGWGDHSTVGYLTSLPTSTGTLTRFTNSVTIESNGDGILNLKQTDAGVTAGTKEGGWNYIQFFDGQGDRQAYIGIDSDGDIRLSAEVPSRYIQFDNTIAAPNANINGVVYAASGNSTEWNTAYGWGNHAAAGYQAAIVTPGTPGFNSSTTSDDAVVISFTSATNAEYYEIYSSVGNTSDYGLIGKVEPGSVASTMTFRDSTFQGQSNTINYKIYAINKGVYGPARTFAHTFAFTPPSIVVTETVVLDTVFVTWEPLGTRLARGYEVRMHATSGTPSFGSSTTVASTKGNVFVYKIPVNNHELNHGFWVTPTY